MARQLKAENAHRLQETLGTLTLDCVFDDYGLGRRFFGRAGIAAYYRLWWQAFGTVVDRGGGQVGLQWMPDGNAFAEARYKGVHRGRFLGIKATGVAVEVPFVVVLTFRDDLMAGKRFYYDLGRLLAQIGRRTAPAVAFPGTQQL